MADLFHAMRQARKRMQPARNGIRLEIERETGRHRRRRVLRIVRAAQRADPGKIGDLLPRSALRPDQF
jgi:hypothetical protein